MGGSKKGMVEIAVFGQIKARVPTECPEKAKSSGSQGMRRGEEKDSVRANSAGAKGGRKAPEGHRTTGPSGRAG